MLLIKLLFNYIVNKLLFSVLCIEEIDECCGSANFGLLWVILNFYVGENEILDEVFITTFLLAGYYLSTLSFKYLEIPVTFLITFATFIKLTAAVLMVPIIYKYRQINPLLVFSFLWGCVLVFFQF